MQSHSSLHGSSGLLLQRLQHFQSLFTTADASGDGSLDEEEFLDAFRSHLGNDDRALRRMFHAIDANCDGSVTWEEFSAYLLLERTAAAAAGADEQSPDGTRKTTPTFYELQSGASPAAAAAEAAHTHHQAPISCLVHPEASGALDRWYSTHSDGVVQVRNGKDLSHMRTYNSGLSAVTSAAYLPSSGLLALGSYSRFLQLMDPSTGRHAGSLQNVASTASLSLDAWPAAAAPAAARAGAGLGLTSTAGFGSSMGGDGGSTSRSVLGVCRDFVAVGDADGSVRLLQLDMGDSADKKTADRFSVRKLWQSSNHRDWVTSVLHCPEISSIAAASLDKTVSMTDLEKCIAVRTLKGHTKPVHCCAWNSLLKVVASGSADRRVLLFNPFSCRTLGVLEGHAAPVVCLASNERDMQLISAAADNTIKVWDLRNQRCLQTLQLDSSASLLGGHQHPLSVLGFSPAGGRHAGQGGSHHHNHHHQQQQQQRLMVAGSVRLQGWGLSDGSGVGVRQGQREAVSWVGHVQDLQEVVSTDHAGTVCCWDLQTGQLLHSFGNAHGGCRISTAALDEDCRRLITGAEDGSISVWNFRSGRLLSAVSRPPADGSSQWGTGSGVEVTGLAVATTTDTNGQAAPCIVATGWDRKVTWYADTGKRKCQLLRSFDGADSDVLAAAAMRGASALATACDNGEVYLWNLESGAVMRKLLAPGLQARPPGERSVEAVAFMHESLKHILVAVGADCVLRFWDCHSGNCLEHDTQHDTATAQGEALCAVAVSPDNSNLVTADTAGNVAVWDVRDVHSALLALATHTATSVLQRQGQRPGSALSSPRRASALGRTAFDGGFGTPASSSNSRPQSAAAFGALPRHARTSAVFGAVAAARRAVGVRRVAGWRAHDGAVTALLWVSAPQTFASAGPSSQLDLGQAATEALVGVATQGSPQPEQQLLFEGPSTAQQQGPPRLHAMEAAEGQQQARQLLAAMQQQRQRQQQQQQQSEELPDARLQQLAAAMQGMHAAAAAAGAESSDGAASAAPAPQPAAREQGFIVSAGLDRTLVLWSTTGSKVGLFGSKPWQLEERSTWREPPDSNDQAQSSNAAGRPGVLLPQHSMDCACSACSSDLGLFSCVPPSHDDPLGTAGDTRLATGSQNPQQQQQQLERQLEQQQMPLADLHASCREQPGTNSKQVSPRQPSQLIKAVAFADDVPAPTPGRSSYSAAAAAAVAAATAEARLPVAEHACSNSSGAMQHQQQQQQQQQVEAFIGGGLGYAPRASSWQSAFASSAWPGSAAATTAAASEPNVVCLAAEEDLPTSLWLPEFTRLALSRPASAAAHRPTSSSAAAAAAAGRIRPSTAAAAPGGGLHSRANGTGRVLAAAGRRSVVLPAGIGGGVLMGERVAGNVSGAGPLGRPKSAGVWQAGRGPGNCGN